MSFLCHPLLLYNIRLLALLLHPLNPSDILGISGIPEARHVALFDFAVILIMLKISLVIPVLLLFQDSQKLCPNTDFYKNLALDCAGDQVAIDLFILTGQFVDLASLCE